MIPDIEQLSGTINNVYDTAYNQGNDHAINMAIVVLKTYQPFFNSVQYREIIEKIEALRTK